MIDVLVAGGGPAGLAAAIRCAQAGLSVTVAEPRPAPVDKACGEGLMPAAVAGLAAIGVHPGGLPFRGIRYLDPDHRADGLFRSGRGLGVRRTALHAALMTRASELGIEVVPARVDGFGQDGDGVRAAGLTARYLVAADGLHSGLRRACGLEPTPAARPRYGLRRHYRVAPWSSMVEVHWSATAEAYVTPVAPDLVGVAILGPRISLSTGPAGAAPVLSGPVHAGPVHGDPAHRVLAGSDPVHGGPTHSDPLLGDSAHGVLARRALAGNALAGGAGPAAGLGFDARLAAFPGLADRLAGADPAGPVRGAGPLRQDVRRRVSGRVLLVGDAGGYLDALTGEGISVALAQARVLAQCLRDGQPGRYERAWRQVSRKSRLLTAGLLWSRHQPALAARIVPAAQRLPSLFTVIVNQVAGG